MSDDASSDLSRYSSRSGSFLTEKVGSTKSFIPEDLTIEQRGMVKTVHDFMKDKVIPGEDKIEALDLEFITNLMREAGQLGLLMAEIPEVYGGLGLGKIEASSMAYISALQGSFNVTYLCHTGIATAPFVFYGTEDQKKKYLPLIAAGEMLAAFALTEPDAGSDAMSIKTKAVLSKDKKHYILNGQKQFTTNGALADVFTVFAMVEDVGMTAFIIEKDFEGFSIGNEEKKMGIHGSSTTSLVLEDVEVPLENVLGEPGKGHHIAFNVLNVGRLKLGSACAGGANHLIEIAYEYTKEREQFRQPLLDFQILKVKLAGMVAKTFLLESLTFRSSGLFDSALKSSDNYEASLREYALEAAICKVFGSETLFDIADETMQMLGGYGYCKEYLVERFLRDARINRIFEGTNEINRLVIAGDLLKKIAKGKIDVLKILSSAEADLQELVSNIDPSSSKSRIESILEIYKLLLLSISALSLQKMGPKIKDEQYVLFTFADMISEIYALDSAYQRSLQVDDETKKEAMIKTIEFYLQENLITNMRKGKNALIHVFPEDSKYLNLYSKVLFSVQNALNLSIPNLAEDILRAVENNQGYPFNEIV